MQDLYGQRYRVILIEHLMLLGGKDTISWDPSVTVLNFSWIFPQPSTVLQYLRWDKLALFEVMYKPLVVSIPSSTR